MEDIEFGLRLENLSKKARNIKRLSDELDKEVYRLLVDFRTTASQMTLSLDDPEESGKV